MKKTKTKNQQYLKNELRYRVDFLHVAGHT